ncbi:Integral membrane protein [Pyrenophora tritici-repentis]|nr:Integral membrane protein [Pyrenophora tritici-repentis]
MRSPPPDVLATWPKPNYLDPVTRGPSLMIVELTLLPIAMIVVFLRLWVRISWLKKSWYDDYLMIVAMIFSIGRHHSHCHHGIPTVRLGPPCMGPNSA